MFYTPLFSELLDMTCTPYVSTQPGNLLHNIALICGAWNSSKIWSQNNTSSQEQEYSYIKPVFIGKNILGPVEQPSIWKSD